MLKELTYRPSGCFRKGEGRQTPAVPKLFHFVLHIKASFHMLLQTMEEAQRGTLVRLEEGE